MGSISVQPPSGAVRSLTEVFILLRNNAVQSRTIFADSGSLGGGSKEERLSLVPLSEDDAGEAARSRIPPEWVNMVDEVQYELTRIRSKLKDLREAETRHLNRPSFSDDSSTEERAIEAATSEITKMLAHSHRLIAHIKNSGTTGRRSEAALQRNVTAALVAGLQELTLELRGSQSTYMRALQSREENFQQYFGPSGGDLLGSVGAQARLVSFRTRMVGTTGRRSEAALQRNVTAALVAGLQELTLELRGSQSTYMRALQSREKNFQQYFGPSGGDLLGSVGAQSSWNTGPDWAELDRQALERGETPAERTMAQIQALEDNTQLVREREREVLAVSKSIIELNTLFKDLSAMVVEQGSVLDRIDYNIEQSTLRISTALKAVQKAEKYQRQNHKMHCIVCLAATIVILLVLLLIKKSLLG